MARSGGSGAIPRRAATHKRRARSRSSTPERHPCDNLRHGDGRVYSGRDGQGGRRKGNSKGRHEVDSAREEREAREVAALRLRLREQLRQEREAQARRRSPS